MRGHGCGWLADSPSRLPGPPSHRIVSQVPAPAPPAPRRGRRWYPEPTDTDRRFPRRPVPRDANGGRSTRLPARNETTRRLLGAGALSCSLALPAPCIRDQNRTGPHCSSTSTRTFFSCLRSAAEGGPETWRRLRFVWWCDQLFPASCFCTS